MTKLLFAFTSGAVFAGGIVYFALRPQPPEPPPPVTQVRQPAQVLEVETPDEVGLPDPPPPAPTPVKKLRQFRFETAAITVQASAELPAPPHISIVASAAEPGPMVLTPVSVLPPPPEPNRVTIPAGTVFNIVLAEDLSTKKNFPGDEFVATLDRPLVVDGFVIVEKDGQTDGLIVESTRAGKVKGASTLAFKLIRLHTTDGQIVDIETDVFEVSGGKHKSRDAAKIGGIASLGALVGGIAGGGAGAAIGAAIGGAAGTGVVLSTRGPAASLPAETRLPIRLSSSLTITEQAH